jgi:hypothetical protein
LFLGAGVRQAFALDVTLRWDANQEPDLLKYKLYYISGSTGNRIPGNYRGTGAAEGASPVDVMPLSSDENPDPNLVEFTLHGLVDGQTYAFIVTACDNENLESGPSNEVATDYSGPGTVLIITSSPSPSTWSNDNTVTITWAAPGGMPPGVGIAGYSIVWDMASGTTPAATKTIDAVTSTTSPAVVDGNRNYFHIRAVDTVGNWGEPEHSGPYYVDTGPPSVLGSSLISGTTVEITYSENNMQYAAVAGSYSLDNGVIVLGVTDVTGEGRIFSLSLSNVQSYVIYRMTVTSGVSGVVDAGGNLLTGQTTFTLNDDDSDGMADDWEVSWFGDTTSKNGAADTDGDGMTDRDEYEVARENPQWGTSRWNLDPTLPNGRDSDGDGIFDNYEAENDMNPVDASDRNLDSDNDGWTNYEEYLYGYAANNANSPAPAPPQVREVIPAGNGPVPSNSTFAVRLEATQGINIAEPSGVTVTVNDGSPPYVRNLDNTTVKAIPLDSGVTTSRSLWIAYYRSNETPPDNEFASGVTVTVTFEATDIRKDSMTPRNISFRIQTQQEEDETAASLPFAIIQTDYPSAGLTTSGVTNTSTMLDSAAIIFNNALPAESGVTPYFGPAAEVPAFDMSGYTGVGVAMNLLPPAVFPSGVTVVVPCPGYTDVSGLYVSYFNGQQWVMACDPNGNVQPGGLGWMVPGSRVNHNGNPAYVEIEVYHFSAVIAATDSGTTVTVETGGGGGGCFISSIIE